MRVFGCTDIGKVRRENQDCFGIREINDGVLAVVCDGMGGAAAGKLAGELSRTFFLNVAEALLKANGGTRVAESLRTAVDSANREIYRKALMEPECSGMGSTLVGLYADSDSVTLVNVGDSRGYRINGNRMIRLTHDHSYVQQLLDEGKITREEARTHPRKNEITRVVGAERFTLCDIFESDFEDNDIFLLCSDGLTNCLTENAIHLCCLRHDNPETLCRALIEAALAAGARDNVTCLALFF